MNNIEPEPPSRTLIRIPVISLPPELLATEFVLCSAEAQFLEHAIKSAIRKDVRVFAAAAQQVSLLEILEKVSLGQAKGIAMRTPHKKDAKGIAACVEFFQFVRMQWSLMGRAEPELIAAFKDAVDRRNRLAHQFLAEVLSSGVSAQDALTFMKDSRDRFFKLRSLIVAADEISSMMGSVAPDGTALARFKTTG